MTTDLKIQTSSASYAFTVGTGILDSAGMRLQQLGLPLDTKVFVVTDDVVSELGYASRVQSGVESVGYEVSVASVPPRDESKSLGTAERLYNALLDFGVRRNGVVVAVGGGVVGDLAGFVAATFLRGIHFIQMPTTLLAHDSSIGGKVGVNLPRGKNLVGAFHQPLAVWMDVETLRTLPAREWRGGMAEVIKHGLIGDVDLFSAIEAHSVPDFPGDAKAEALIARAVRVKIAVVEEDERESNTRMVLNLGHTVGHAVEQESHYQINHGEAVAIGLAVEAEIAFGRGWLSGTERDRVLSVLQRHGLPISPPNYPFESIVRTLNLDKKHTNSGWTFVLPKSIGRVQIAKDVTYAELKTAWERAHKESGLP